MLQFLPLLFACTRSAPISTQPSILLVTLDTTRADALGSYGGPPGATPTLDALAAGGLRFSRAYTTAPLTIPAHSSLFTGLWPPHHGVRDNGDYVLSDSLPHLALGLRKAGYATGAFVGAEVTSHHWGFRLGFDTYDDDMGLADPDSNSRWEVQRPADQVVDRARAWLSAREPAQPWFLWVHLFDAHAPYLPPEPFASRFADEPYQGEVSFVDAQLGALLQAVDALEQPVWVLALADHGEDRGDHGEGMHGVLLYSATTHIPLIIRPPDPATPPRVIEDPVSIVDIAPTLRALAHAAPAPMQDGVDMSALLLDPQATHLDGPPRALYSESLYAWRHFGWAPQRALVTATEHLIDSTTPELYAANDLAEQTDLAASQPQRVATLRARLDSLVDPSGRVPQDGDRAALSPERTRQLQALGYLGVGPQERMGLPPFGRSLPDPVTSLPVLSKVQAVRALLMQDELPAARAAAEDLVRDHPEITEGALLLAQVRGLQGDIQGSRQVLEAVEARQPSSTARAMLGSLALREGDLAAARSWLSQSLDLDPNLGEAWVRYLHVLLLQGDRAALDPSLAQARKLLPDDPQVGGVAGIVAALDGDIGTAEPKLAAAMANDPLVPMLHFATALVWRAKDQAVRAEAELLEEARLYPPALPARTMLVELYADQQRYAEQLAQLSAIEAVEAPSALTAHSRAQALYNLGRYDEALRVVTECEALAPAYPACRALEANTLRKLGREDAAQAAWKRAQALAAAVR